MPLSESWKVAWNKQAQISRLMIGKKMGVQYCCENETTRAFEFILCWLPNAQTVTDRHENKWYEHIHIPSCMHRCNCKQTSNMQTQHRQECASPQPQACWVSRRSSRHDNLHGPSSARYALLMHVRARDHQQASLDLQSMQTRAGKKQSASRVQQTAVT